MVKDIWKWTNTPWVILSALLSGLTIVILFTFQKYGTTFDERDMIALGNHVLRFYTSFGKDTSFLTLSKEPEFFLTHGSFIEVVRSAIVAVLPIHSLDIYHLILALLSVFAFFFIFTVVYAITKNVWVSGASFLLLLCMPRFYGDIFTNSKDITPAVILLGIIYFSTRLFEGKRKLLYLLGLGTFFAIGVSLRPILLIAYVVFFALSFLQTLVEKQSMRAFLKVQLILFFTSVVSFFLISPYLLLKPAEIMHLISASEKYPWTGAILFERLMYNPRAIPWYYLPEWITITTPVVTLLFFALGNVGIVFSLFKKNFPNKYIFSFIFLLFWVPIAVVFYQKPIIYDSWRQFLFLTGPLILIATLGVWTMVQSKIKVLVIATALLVGINLLLTTQEMSRLHPYEYIYFNSLIGGLKGAYGKYETDYWGASFKETTEWIDAHHTSFSDADGTTYISPCLPFLAAPYLKPGIEINNIKARLAYCYTRWDEDKNMHGNIIYEVEREGVPLNVIKVR